MAPVITYLFPQNRSLVLLAKQAVTLQDLSEGRLEFRTGADATLQWSLQWWHPYGIDYPNNVDRVTMLEEGIHILSRLWKCDRENGSENSINYTGKYYKLNGASIKPHIRVYQ